jgi:Uma2 family endonuclease
MASDQTALPLSVDEYHRLGELGLLDPDLRVELLDGEIVEMNAIGSRHASTVSLLQELLSRKVPTSVIVWTQNPVRLNRFAEPVPDISLLIRRPGHYRDAHPGPGDMLLVVEVADSSLRLDRERKVPIYARAEVPEVWLVDLASNLITIYRDPAAGTYRTILQARRGDVVSPQALPAVHLEIEAIIPQG